MTPFVVMVMSGIAGMFEYGSCGRLVFSFVKTDLNWLLRISALSLLSDSTLLSFIKVGIPTVSTLRLFMYDQNRFGESEQMDDIYLL